MPRKLFRHLHNNLMRRRRSVKRTTTFERLESRSLMAVAPELFRDINTGTLPSNPYGFTELAGEVYFFATDRATDEDYAQQPEPLPPAVYDPQPTWPVLGPAPLRDVDLWKTDGTAVGTVRVKDLPPSREYPDQLTAAGTTLFFAAYSEATGKELWKSDGTTAGTVLVEDILPGPRSSGIWSITAAGDQVFFVADDGVHDRELWKSDGTAVGTRLVSDFTFGPHGFKVVGSQVFFTANDGVRGNEIWKSDGTQAGTTPLLTQPGAIGTGIGLLPVVGSTLYFQSIMSTQVRWTLWKTDGTEAGTVAVVEELVPQGRDYTSFGSHLYFTRWTQSGDELWRTDGTPEGTVLVETPSPGVVNRIGSLRVVGDRLFFLMGDMNSPARLWATAGDPGAAMPVHTFDGYILEQFVATADRLYISAYRRENQRYELWASDGTADGTMKLRAFDSPMNGGWGWRMTAIGDALYFAPDDGQHGVEAWMSHGTPETTRLVADVNQDSASSRPFGFVQVRNQLFFFATDPQWGMSLYRTDGSATGIRRLGVASSSEGVVLGGRLLFLGPHHGSGTLWITDGTLEGTVPLATPHATGPLYSIGQLTRVGDHVYFTGGNGSVDGLWKTDGTVDGTVLVRAGLSPKRLTAVGDRVFFLSRGEADYDLWVSDDTFDGTKLLHAKPPGSPRSSPFYGAYVQPGSMIALGRRLLISRYSPERGEELWVSDGTPEGTRLLKDLVAGVAGSSPRLMTRVGDTVYFVSGGREFGQEITVASSDVVLWKTDGTARGTRRVMSFSNAADPSHLTAVGDQLFFVGGDDESGFGLWRTDGTQRGTRLVLQWSNRLFEVLPGTPILIPGMIPIDRIRWLGPKIGWLTDVSGVLYFQFNDGRHGPELWRSDGTTRGTWMVTDQRPGPEGAAPTNLTPFKGRLYYAAHDEEVGVELFSIDVRGITRTVNGSARGDTWRVVRRGDRIEVRGSSGRIFAASISSISELILETRGGNDSVVVDAGDGDLGVRLRIEGGRGTNSLWIKSGTVTVTGGAQRGRLNVTVAAGAILIATQLDASSLRVLRTGRVV